MLKRFEVSGFKQFSHLVLDFSNIRDYAFNQSCIKKQLVKDGIIYGRNASGKTNLGLALFDIIAHLTDKTAGEEFYSYYLKADDATTIATFTYEFQLEGNHHIQYQYQKASHHTLYGETLCIDGVLVLQWTYQTPLFISPDFLDTYKFGKI